MKQYNKAIQGGAGPAITLILSWIAKEFLSVEVPAEIQLAVATGLAVLFPALGPKNAT